VKMEDEQHRAHVAVLPYPSQGHINPLLQFAKRLASKGLKATMATTRYTVRSIHAPNVGVEPISDGFDEEGFAQAGNEAAFLKSFEEHGSRTLSQLLQKYSSTDTPVACVVYDSFFPWALDVAKQHGIFGAAFFTNSVAISNIFYRLHSGLLELPLELHDGALSLPGLPLLKLQDVPSFLLSPGSYPAYLAMKLGQFTNTDKADWIFGNSFEALEYEEAKSISDVWPAKLIGPMVPSTYLDSRQDEDNAYGASLWKPLRLECTNWLDTKPPKSIVYVSFGSMVSLTPEQMEEIAWGLKESGFPFLWVVRPSELDKLPQGLGESVQEKVMIATWCNQLEVLAHRATGCFVTHCGWNSVLEGLSVGVPMIGIPRWADQSTNAKYVEETWGVGVRAKEDEGGVVRREEVTKCVNEVMSGERSDEMKRNVWKWRELAKEAIGEGGSSGRCINEFVECLTSHVKGGRQVD
ncbi:Glycosyltransferase, partial [Psidium guajava]